MNEDNTTTALTVLQQENVRLASDFDEQRRLFAKFGYNDPGPFLMGHNAIVKTPEGGYKMVQRENPVNFEFDLDGHMRCVRSAQRTYAERVGGLAMRTLSNPATMKHVVENQLCQSVEPGEVAAWATV